MPKSQIQAAIKAEKLGECAKDYCSRKCACIAKRTRIKFECDNCKKTTAKVPSQWCQNNFCSQSCSASFHNARRNYGYRRSKIEIFIEDRLREKYPNLDILFNSKSIITSELDIYIPSLHLAFEINGICHYRPIYGEKKFLGIQRSDARKKERCRELSIALYIIDVSDQGNFTIQSSQKYLDSITELIEKKMVLRAGLQPARSFEHSILSGACMAIPPPEHLTVN